MAYPPSVPSNARTNATASFDNHPDDHNAIADALNDIISELGTGPKGSAADVTTRLAQLVPPGVVSAYAGSSAPTGYLLCQGQAVSRTTYADLFSAIGTGFGVGDGSTTFNVPDLQNRFPAGKGSAGWSNVLNETGGDKDAIVPNHTHASGSYTAASSGSAHYHVVNPPQTTLNIANPPAGVSPSSTGDVGKASGTGYDRDPITGTVNIVGFNSNTDGAHTHSVSGSSGAATDGASVTNANLPPYVTLNYIIKT